MNNYTVYMHTNTITNKKYIGITCQSCQARWRNGGMGYKSQPKFFSAIVQYGWDNFTHEIIAENLTSKEASLLEQDLIEQYDSINNGYNVALGGQVTHHSQETIEKIRSAMYGKTHSEQTKEQIRQSKKNTWIPVICLDDNKKYERIADAEKETGIDKSSITKCCQGLMLTAGGKLWRYADPAMAAQYETITNNRINKAKKPVYCITTDMYYETVKEAAEATGSDASNLIKVCKGKYKTTNGLQWRYASWDELKQRGNNNDNTEN